MDLEQQLRSTYADRLGALDLPSGDAAAARRTGARMHARRRVAVGLAAVAVVAVGVGSALLGSGRVSIGPSGGAGHWRELPAAPLSPRADALSVWTGSELVVVGGDTEPCPPNASCVEVASLRKDGAAYVPSTGRWHPIADAPIGVGPGDRLVAAGGKVVLRKRLTDGEARYFVYDPDGDSWTMIGTLGVEKGTGLPSALGSEMYVVSGRRVSVLDVSRGSWRELPIDPIRPSLTQRSVPATDVGPVVTGYDSTQPNDGRSPSVVLADVFDGKTWRRLPATGQLDNLWTWNGSRMVDADPSVVDGGETEPFPHPYPAGGLLDPATGEWSALPRALSADTGEGWGVNAAGPRWFASYGQVYDSQTGSVVRLSRPDGAAEEGTAAAWAEDSRVVFGGATFGPKSELSNQAWSWSPTS